MALESLLEQFQESNSEPLMDRIGSLPDELLIKILDCLPTKYAFITSILSRRWSHLFKEVKHMDFDNSLLLKKHYGFDHLMHCSAFEAFICKMLDCSKVSNLSSFRFKHRIECWCNSNVEYCWLETVLCRGIQELDLFVDHGSVVLPSSLFTCNTLCVVKLSFSSVIHIPCTVSMQCLKILHLNQVSFPDVDSFSKLFSGCPLIEEVVVKELILNEVSFLSISAPSLKILKLGSSCFMSQLFSIVAPLLECFNCDAPLAKSYSIEATNYLVEAHLDIFKCLNDFEDQSSISRSARELVQGVSSVKSLFLSAPCLEALTYVKDELPILRNLTKLELSCSLNPKWHVTLLRLLESAPHLEELIFSKGFFAVGCRDKDVMQAWLDYWERRQDVPCCLKTRLKVIEIQHFVGLNDEVRMVRYFLWNCKVLTGLIIHSWLGKNNKSKVRTRAKLKKFARPPKARLSIGW